MDVPRPKECSRDFLKRKNYPDYEDETFPPDSISIGKDYRKDLVIFKRGTAMYKSSVFGKYIDPNDIKPGTMSSPQFLSTLSCLAER